MSAELHYLGHALTASFEANLAYSIVIQFSSLSAVPIQKWIHAQHDRAIGLMSDTQIFDLGEFKKGLDGVLENFKSGIEVLNRRCIVGAFCVAIVDIILLFCVGPFPDLVVPTWLVILGGVLVFGPVGVGLVGVFGLDMRAKSAMRTKTKEIDNLFKWFRRNPAEQVEKATAALDARMLAEGAAS